MQIRTDFVSNSSSSSYIIPNSNDCKKLVRFISDKICRVESNEYGRENPTLSITFTNKDEKFVRSIFNKMYRILWKEDIIRELEKLDDDAEFSEADMNNSCNLYVTNLAYEGEEGFRISWIPIQYLYAFSKDSQLIKFIDKIEIDLGDGTFNNCIISQILLLFHILGIKSEPYDHGSEIEHHMRFCTNDFFSIIYDAIQETRN